MSQTRNKTLLFIAAALVLLNAACTTVKPVYNSSQQTYSNQIKPGDKVRLTYMNDRVKDIRVTEINEQEIRGTLHKNTPNQRKGSEVVADWKDVYAVETVKVSALKTTGAALGVVVAIPFLALGAVMAGCTGAGGC